MKKILSILLAILVIAACATTDANAKTRRSSTNSSTKTKATPEAVKNAYIKQLKHLDAIEKESTSKYEYFLFDISGDNVPEMFVQVGTCDMDYVMHVYTYSGGRAKEVSGARGLNRWASGYKEKDGILIIPQYNRGKWYAQKITLTNNRIKLTTIKQGTMSSKREDLDYFDTFKYVDTYKVYYYEPLEKLEF